MKKLNELEPIENFDAFEILDLEEKLDYAVWSGDECDCKCKPA
jgi:hypothetical protein